MENNLPSFTWTKKIIQRYSEFYSPVPNLASKLYHDFKDKKKLFYKVNNDKDIPTFIDLHGVHKYDANELVVENLEYVQKMLNSGNVKSNFSPSEHIWCIICGHGKGIIKS